MRRPTRKIKSEISSARRADVRYAETASNMAARGLYEARRGIDA